MNHYSLLRADDMREIFKGKLNQAIIDRVSVMQQIMVCNRDFWKDNKITLQIIPFEDESTEFNESLRAGMFKKFVDLGFAVSASGEVYDGEETHYLTISI